MLWFLGSHSLNLSRWLLDSEIVDVQANTLEKVLKKKLGIETPDFYLFNIKFNNGTVLNMGNCWVLPNKLSSVVFEFNAKIVGTKEC